MQGSVLVIGGGIAGIQTSLDLTELGFKVYLVEKSPSIGGSSSASRLEAGHALLQVFVIIHVKPHTEKEGLQSAYHSEDQSHCIDGGNDPGRCPKIQQSSSERNA